MDHEEICKKILPLIQALRLYHQHEVVGFDKLRSEERLLVIANHSLATYDIVLLMAAIYTDLKRLPRPLVDRLFFRIPLVGELISLFGAVPGSPSSAHKLLKEGEMLTVAPGGMREALRPSSQRYQIRWDKRIGFARLAIKAEAPVVLAACPKADDLYDVYPSWITSWVYRNYKIPLFFARGLGPTPLPRPVKLVHFLSEPILPPKPSEDEMEMDKIVKKFHSMLVKRMHKLISEAIHYR